MSSNTTASDETTLNNPATTTSFKDSCANACAVCAKSDNLLRCSRCKVTVYCSKDHQKSDWKQHRSFCKAKSHVESNVTAAQRDSRLTGPDIQTNQTKHDQVRQKFSDKLDDNGKQFFI